MVDADRFWQSDIPFISSVEGKRVDWQDVTLAALATLGTSLFSSIADLIATLWETTIIIPLNFTASEYVRLSNTITDGIVGVLDFGPAISIAQDTGLIGSIVIVVIGAYIVSLIIGVIR